jgi:hypothetical protein
MTSHMIIGSCICFTPLPLSLTRPASRLKYIKLTVRLFQLKSQINRVSKGGGTGRVIWKARAMSCRSENSCSIATARVAHDRCWNCDILREFTGSWRPKEGGKLDPGVIFTPS